MSKKKLKILLVDDDPVLIELHSALLEENNYSVIAAEDGVQALRLLENYYESIGVVVSDITMPNMDGYELCTNLKNDENTRNIPLIFVSALTSLEEKLKGYSVGADDYIPKPVTEKELCKKISVLLDMREKQNSLRQEVSETRDMAMQAMSFSSELGQVVDFYKNVMIAHDYADTAKHVFELMAGFSLVSIMQVNTSNEVLYLSGSGIVTPLEENVIELARDKGRFFDFGARTIINYSTFSILVKNMPIDDKEKYGRLKDILGMIGNGLETRMHQLNNEHLANKKYEMIIAIKDSINSINQSFSDLQKENITAIEDMNEQVRDAIMVLGLTEPQENNIQSITESCLQKTSKAFYKGLSIEENLKQIYQQFHNVLGVKT